MTQQLLSFPGIVTFDPDHPGRVTENGQPVTWVGRLNAPGVALGGRIVTFALDRDHACKHLARELYADVHGCEPEEVALEHAWAWFATQGFVVTWLT